MSDYKPGDVAMVTAYNRREPYRAYFDGRTWREYDADIFCVDVPTDVRPLVVLDLPERVVAPLVEYLRGVGDQKIAGDRLDLIADQIEAQTKPPKPAEPTGLGAVVEDADGVLWTRTEHRPNITGTVWTSAFHRTMPEKTEMSSGRVPAARARMSAEWWSQTRDYRDIDAVRVLSEGEVEAGIIRKAADEIKAQTEPPKPDEPTSLGAVVEDSSHIKWVRVSNTPGTFPWVADGRGVEGWSRIDVVRVLSEGVTQ